MSEATYPAFIGARACVKTNQYYTAVQSMISVEEMVDAVGFRLAQWDGDPAGDYPTNAGQVRDHYQAMAREVLGVAFGITDLLLEEGES